MKILSVKPESMIEWPSHISYIIFLAGCNFRCPFCYVPHLVLPQVYQKIKGKSEEEVLQDIKKRSNFIDAVCITGGEPTIHPELPVFLQKIKQACPNLKLRLETNGSNPEMIKTLIKEKLVDSVALDIKNSEAKYSATCGLLVNPLAIEKTINIVRDSGIDYEFRTTLVPGLHELKDILAIAEWLGSSKLYALQQFCSDLPNEGTINPSFIKKANYPVKEMQKIKQELEALGTFEKIEIRAKE